jgi:hypothetical protein
LLTSLPLCLPPLAIVYFFYFSSIFQTLSIDY